MHGRIYLGQFSRINRLTEAAFSLNNRVNVPLTVKENCIPENVMKDTTVLALTIILGGVGVYFGPPCHGYAYNCLFVYLAIKLEIHPFLMQTFLLIYKQQQKIKFAAVQINKKQVSYLIISIPDTCLLSYFETISYMQVAESLYCALEQDA